jgi:hypothetical protein
MLLLSATCLVFRATIIALYIDSHLLVGKTSFLFVMLRGAAWEKFCKLASLITDFLTYFSSSGFSAGFMNVFFPKLIPQ